MLEGLECSPLEAAQGEEARRIIAGADPAAVLISLDSVDAGLASSVDLIRALCGDNPDLLVAAYTAQADQLHAVEALKAGVTDFLRKPFAVDELRAVLNRFLAAIQRRTNRTISPEFLREAKLTFKLESWTNAVIPVVNVISTVLDGFLDAREEMRLALGLEEGIRNAFEHGNLGISFAEKNLAIEAGTFEELIRERSAKARAAGLTVDVSVEISEGIFKCVIRDQGKGFNWRPYLDSAAAPSPDVLHGRGVMVVTRIFDRVSYNESGNELTLVKRLTSRRAS